MADRLRPGAPWCAGRWSPSGASTRITSPSARLSRAAQPRRRSHRPILRPPRLDRREVQSGQRIPVVGQRQFPEREEVAAHIQPLLISARTEHDLMAGVQSQLAEIFRQLHRVIDLNHYYQYTPRTARIQIRWDKTDHWSTSD